MDLCAIAVNIDRHHGPRDEGLGCRMWVLSVAVLGLGLRVQDRMDGKGP